MTGGLARKRRRSAKLRLARAMLLGCCGEKGGRRNVAQAGLNKTHATIMDMSAKESLQCPNGVPHTRGAGAPACCRRSGSPRAAVVTAILIAFSLSFAGCGIPQAGTTARSSRLRKRHPRRARTGLDAKPAGSPRDTRAARAPAGPARQRNQAPACRHRRVTARAGHRQQGGGETCGAGRACRCARKGKVHHPSRAVCSESASSGSLRHGD